MAGQAVTVPRAAVLGSPIAHSISPDLHLAAYRDLGLDWAYERFEVDDAAFPDWFAGLDPAQWRGLSLTMPLKEVAHQLMARLSPFAAATGAVNTVTWSQGEQGPHPVGDNTDVHGIAQALHSSGLIQIDTACVLGAGATARSAVLALSQLGAERITILARSAERSQAALDLAASLGIAAAYAPLRRMDLLGGADAIVSALPQGVADALAGDVRDGGLDSNPFAGEAGILLDVVYRAWPTPLAQAWADVGGRIVSGFEMLLHQAAAQVRLMTGHEPPVEAMRAAGEAALASSV